MATYLELFSLRNNSDLVNRVAVACVIAADEVRTEDPLTEYHTERLSWAAKAMNNPLREAKRMLWTLLASNSTIAINGILSASDSEIQTQVNAAVVAAGNCG